LTWAIAFLAALAVAAAVMVYRRWGSAAGAAACVTFGVLFVPPVWFVSPILLWREVLVGAGLLTMLAVAWWRRGALLASNDGPSRPRVAGDARAMVTVMDLALAGFVLLPLVSAMVNRQALGQAGLEVAEQAAWWGLPYAAGRMLLSGGLALGRAAAVVVVALAVYAPLCLIESLGRPALAERLFGVAGPNINATPMLLYFWGPMGYRPFVFTGNFFELMLLQATAVTLAAGLWLSAPSGAEGRRWRMVASAGGGVNLVAVMLLSRSWVGVFLPLGLLTLLGSTWLTRWRMWPVAASLLLPVYIGLRASEMIPTDPLPLRNNDGSEFLVGRGRSINERTRDERRVLELVSEQAIFGTGTAHRQLDGGWKVRGKYNVDSGAFTMLLRWGYVGLVGLVFLMLGPVIWLVVRTPTETWREGWTPVVLASGTVLVGLTVNLIPNSASSGVYPLLAGGLMSLGQMPEALGARPRRDG
jgi:hypothetical protein